jgi:hypothetical protein
MAHILFVDESGQDRSASPYEVLAGVAVEDQDIWNLIKALHEAEERHFGTRYTKGREELKAKKLLKRKTFRLAAQLPPMPVVERRLAALRCLKQGAQAGKTEITGLAQAKLAYVEELLAICGRFRCKAFASIVNRESPRPSPEHLRKDYAYLFERFFYFLEDYSSSGMGIVAFDELEKSRSHVLINQMDRYFSNTAKGQLRAGRIIPEPFFVHSDLTTGVQLADIMAYLVSWGFRTGDLKEPVRAELKMFVDAVCSLRHKVVREVDGNPNFAIWSFSIIEDLRSRDERDG